MNQRSLKTRISLVRYNYWMSHVLVNAFRPLHAIVLSVARWIDRKIKANGFSVTYVDIKIVFPRNIGVNINSGIFWKGMDGFEPLTSRSLIAFFKQADVFLDIGSNFGFYSVVAQKVNTSISVFCFEPLKNIYEDNIRFHQANKTTRQTICNIALSHSVGKTTFYVPDVYSVASEITSGTVEKDFAYNQQFKQKEITIDTTTLDLFLADKKEQFVGRRLILKIDVEGHEASVLAGGRAFFCELRPVIIMEIDKNGANISHLNDWFKEMNYRVFGITQVGFFALSGESLLRFRGGRDFLVAPEECCENADYFTFDQLPSLLKARDK